MSTKKLLAGLAAAMCLPWSGAEAGPARAGTIESTPLGLLGCFSGTTTLHYFCLASWDTADGVRVVVLGEAGSGVVTDKYVEDVVVPSGALRGLNGGVELTADLPRTGRIELSSTVGRHGPATTNRGCAAYALTYDLVSDGGASVIGGGTTDTGTIGGVAVHDLRCNAHITGPTSGTWALAVLVEEGVLATPAASANVR